MKKIITVLLTVVCFSSVFAQSGRNDDHYDRNADYGRDKENSGYAYNDRYRNNYYNREKAYQMEKINQEYEYKIHSIMRNMSLRPRDRNRLLRNVENEKAAKIRELNYRYSHDRFQDDHYDRGNNYHH
jgi:hypothetical protein